MRKCEEKIKARNVKRVDFDLEEWRRKLKIGDLLRKSWTDVDERKKRECRVKMVEQNDLRR